MVLTSSAAQRPSHVPHLTEFTCVWLGTPEQVLAVDITFTSPFPSLGLSFLIYKTRGLD